jgi:hypothetical protein
MKNASERRQQSDSFVQEAVYHIVRLCQLFLCLKEVHGSTENFGRPVMYLEVFRLLVWNYPMNGHFARAILGSVDQDTSARQVSGKYSDAEAAPGPVWEPGAWGGGLVAGLFRTSWVVARGSLSFGELCAEDVELFDCGGLGE